MNVPSVFSNDTMIRQISERIMIDKVLENTLMNSKSKWNFFSISHAMVSLDRT